jgi:hypothetical protein
MDNKILSELYLSIYQEKGIVDEGEDHCNLINYFITEGYFNTVEEAEVSLSVMSESKIQEIISKLN